MFQQAQLSNTASNTLHPDKLLSTVVPVRPLRPSGAHSLRHPSSGGFPCGVESLGCLDARDQRTGNLGRPRDSELMLCFVEAADSDLDSPRTRGRLARNELVISSPRQTRRPQIPQVAAGRLHYLILDVAPLSPGDAWRWPNWMALSEQDIIEFTDFLSRGQRPVWHATARLRESFAGLANIVDQAMDDDRQVRLTAQLNALFWSLLEMFRTDDALTTGKQSATQRNVQMFLADLRGNLPQLGKKWTVREMAACCGLGVTQFVEHCKQATDTTPIRFLNQCRLEVAAVLLTQGSKTSIGCIARTCGYSSGQYFATSFARFYGQSPREFRSSRHSA